jgi:hypothetical protein
VPTVTPTPLPGAKVTLCHKGKNTLSVGAPAVRAHLAHGDALDECPDSKQVVMCQTKKNGKQRTILVSQRQVEKRRGRGETLGGCSPVPPLPESPEAPAASETPATPESAAMPATPESAAMPATPESAVASQSTETPLPPPEGKVAMCHTGRSGKQQAISVSRHTVQARMERGYTLGECSGPPE